MNWTMLSCDVCGYMDGAKVHQLPPETAAIECKTVTGHKEYIVTDFQVETAGERPSPDANKAAVLAAYPKATVIDWRGPHGLDNVAYYIYPDGLIFQAISRGWSNEVDAWKDAAERLAASPVAPEVTQIEVSDEDDAYGIPENRQCVCFGSPGCEICGGSGDLNDALKPCPFCGTAAKWNSEEVDGGAWIECSNRMCACSTVMVYSLKEDGRPKLRAIWNHRAATPESNKLAAIRESMHARLTAAQWRNEAFDRCAEIAERYEQPFAAADMRAMRSATPVPKAIPSGEPVAPTKFKEAFDKWFEGQGMRLAQHLYVDGLELGYVRDFARDVWRAALMMQAGITQQDIYESRPE